ncbi:MAG: ATP-binding protein [Thermoplasmata archaeon]|nr:ATP-binding protein [Thermoplasmata archaeon]
MIQPGPAQPQSGSLTGGQAGADPFGEAILSYLCSRSYESSELDFKETLETAKGSNFAKVARHFFGMTNYGGGFLLVGFREKPTGGFLPVGLPENFHIDQAELQGKFNAFASVPLPIGYRELERTLEGITRRFAVVYVPPGPEPITPLSDGRYHNAKGRERIAFVRGEVLIRRGTSTMKANPSEVAWIRQRAKDTAYQLSLLSGAPDGIDEILSSNIFPAIRLPARVFRCLINLGGNHVPNHGLNSCLVVGRALQSFEDPSRTSLHQYIEAGSLRSDPLSEWQEDPELSRRLMQLYESALVLKGTRLGMGFDWARRRFFYPLAANDSRREEEWEGITKRASRQVAVRRYLGSLKREVVIHSSVRTEFHLTGGKIHLQLEPGFLLSEDGRHPLHGQKQGNVLIGLESWLSSHNGGYLRNVLFWSSRLLDPDRVIRLGPELEFSGKPAEARVRVGIREDTLRSVEGRSAGIPEIAPEAVDDA